MYLSCCRHLTAVYFSAVVNASPLPQPLVEYFSEHNIQVKPRNLYPVLDLSTEEAADAPPLGAFMPSVEPCPEPEPLMANQPRFYNTHNGFGDGVQMLNRRQRRRHNRRQHNRRHSGRRSQRYRGQH